MKGFEEFLSQLIPASFDVYLFPSKVPSNRIKLNLLRTTITQLSSAQVIYSKKETTVPTSNRYPLVCRHLKQSLNEPVKLTLHKQEDAETSAQYGP